MLLKALDKPLGALEESRKQVEGSRLFAFQGIVDGGK